MAETTQINFPLGGEVYLTLTAPTDYQAEEGSHTVLMATEVFAGALAMLKAKDRQYGGAWREQGWMGNLARIMSKTARLRNMLWRDSFSESYSGERVQDTLQDLINLCAFTLLNMQGGNRWGRGE